MSLCILIALLRLLLLRLFEYGLVQSEEIHIAPVKVLHRQGKRKQESSSQPLCLSLLLPGVQFVETQHKCHTCLVSQCTKAEKPADEGDRVSAA